MMLIRSFHKCSSSVHGGGWYLDFNSRDLLVLFSLISPFKKECAFHRIPLIALSSFSIIASWYDVFVGVGIFLKE